MTAYKNLFKQTIIYGIATVLPRVISFLLVGLHTQMMPKISYGEITILLSYMIFFNVILSYGMETTFFRFYHKETQKDEVISTASVSIFWSSILFLCGALLFQKTISNYLEINKEYVNYAIWILALDALVIIPFSKLRAEQRPIKYATIKIANVCINMLLNIFLLAILPKLAIANPTGFWSSIYVHDYQIGYVFLANLMASLCTFLFFIPNYIQSNWLFNPILWKQMMRYGWPILFAGLAFGINEHFDKILLSKLLPESIAKAEVGAYAACYKIGLFMVLFRTAYTLGIEPFFFSQAGNSNAPQTYATVTKYFVILGSLIMLVVIVFADVIKFFLVRQPEYWEAMSIVPLIIIANFFLGIYTSLSVWYKLIDKTIIGAYISVVGAVLTLLLNYLLIPTMSYMGSAIATLVAYGSMMLFSYFLGKEKYPIPFEMNKIMAYLGVSITLACLSFYIDIFRKTYIFGILAILGFSFYIYKNEKDVILKTFKLK
ncbi:polysaccharide biosynthesis C-terminal domain-containing protein [Flavobacterium sp. 20NA77.7]|uniref:Polysaccharide biosynthesis C-terminal domain-containing protein n=1 Tax=Flavobacterium nakdongensis TaxID=3073563 RepID=A0ABY9RA07_9FLAO|nr:polysaccharide biosynthesis C-terminal domain-containing protein [Flavobacterium sp. 20NA77.7]WMW78063.1 polysaccharide biosynthesis C-terminal domain-containing protein [Flavobacterium sp. 20NA77.7]